MAIDFTMKAFLDQNEFGISWKGAERLTYLDFADDFALLAECLRLRLR